MESIIGKVLESKLFGKGIIIHEEDGLIWIDFSEAKKYNVCFQATSSFAGESPF